MVAYFLSCVCVCVRECVSVRVRAHVCVCMHAGAISPVQNNLCDVI